MSNIIDIDQIYQSGVPGIDFKFNSDGQAFTIDGIPVTGVTFGFNPMPPIYDSPTFVMVINTPALPVILPVAPSVDVPREVPIIPSIVTIPCDPGTIGTIGGDTGMVTPEPSAMWLLGTGIILILASRSLLTWVKGRI